jgi:hypothetical protein
MWFRSEEAILRPWIRVKACGKIRGRPGFVGDAEKVRNVECAEAGMNRTAVM